MANPLGDRILEELVAPGVETVVLLQRYHSEQWSKTWEEDARLYRAFGRQLVRIGQPTLAFEVIREGLAHHPADADLLYLRAFALARGRNVWKAEEYVQELLQVADLQPRLRVEALSLAGRLKKDRYQASAAALRVRLAQESAQLYAAAYELSREPFPAVNAATMSLLAGEAAEKVHSLACAARQSAMAQRDRPGQRADYWLLATLGEAHLLLGDVAGARLWYEQAVRGAAGLIGDIASMRRQVGLLLDRSPAAREIVGLFHIGAVVTFAGHMIDRPGGPPGGKLRFAPDPRLEERVREAIRVELDELQPAVGYCCGACGSDLLFAELMLERRKELHLVLPFAKKDFYTTSVDFGLQEMRAYRQRFDAVVERAQVHYGTEESYLGEKGLLAFVNAYCQGLTLARAAELGVDPWALAVADPASPAREGGTRHFLDQWEAQGRRTRIVDLARLRDEVQPEPPSWWQTARPATAGSPGRLRREVKVMLFADVKNYSKLSDQQAPAFFVSFLGEVGRVIQALPRCPAMCNTWGDGLFLVFNDVLDGADFALRLLERIEQMNFAEVGLPPDTTVRIGLHAGPVYPQWDQLIGRLNFFGTHVNRAARIEPKTPPGCVYASEHFAALLAVEPAHDFVCEYAGVYLLGKEHDLFRCTLYRLQRKGE
jgi:class 3 adenylate cyclase/tetratricopeptide (TPR) repeat protein